MLHYVLAVAAFLSRAGEAQFLPPGTMDVPVPRPGDCGGAGPATYVQRLSTATPNDFFPGACSSMGGATVRFNNPCAWAHGQAQLTTAHFTNMCKGASRTIHWHNTADEWGFVNKGRLETYVASPDGLPWPSSHNVISDNGVWYFPAGWLHGLLCHTPEEEGGCEFTIVFASPQAAEPNGHNLDTTLAQAPRDIGAFSLGVTPGRFAEYRPAFARAEHSIHYSNKNMTAPIVTMLAAGSCEPRCPPVAETVAAPAAIDTAGVEKKVLLPGAHGVALYQIRTDQFPFARTMSQERVELAPGAFRPMVWASGDAAMVVIRGKIIYSLEGGIPGSESKALFANETLEAGDVAYIPNGRAYWFREASGKDEAMTITVFNVGNWKNFEMAQSLPEMNQLGVASNLHLGRVEHPQQATFAASAGHGQLRAAYSAQVASLAETKGMTELPYSVLLSALGLWVLLLTAAVLVLLRKVQSQGRHRALNSLLA